MPCEGAKRIVNENREIKLLLEFWPYGLKQAGANWGELIEMLEGFAMKYACLYEWIV